MAATKKGVWGLQDVRDKQLESEWSYTAGARDPGQAWVWGSNNRGALGVNLGQGIYYSSPVQLPGTNWVDLQVGTMNRSMGLKDDNTLWSWGYNYRGDLGHNNRTAYSSPVQIPGSWKNFVKESGSPGQQQAIRTDGTFWSWGYQSGVNNLRITDGVTRSSPVQMGSDTNWLSGKNYSKNLYLLKTNGELWALGQNFFGELGNNGYSGGGDWAASSKSSPVQIPGTTWSQVGGPCAVKTDGTLWMWGNNSYGELGQNSAGIPTRRSSPVQVPGTTWSKLSSCSYSTYAIKTDGTLWSWGYNKLGELGLNEMGSPSTTSNSRSSPTQIPGTTWSEVASCNYGGYAIKTDGTLWTWGYAGDGRLGLNQPESSNKSSPVQIPGTTWANVVGDRESAIAIKTDGTLWSWGNNAYGGLGLNQGTPGNIKYSSPTQIPGTTWSAKNHHSGANNSGFAVMQES